MSIDYRGISDVVYFFSDAAVSFSGGQFIFGLDPDEFHTFRLESPDGVNYRVSVDGKVFIVDDTPFIGDEQHTVQFGGDGGCPSRPEVVVNEWDFVRYGELSYGEQVVGTDPPAGVLDAVLYGNLDRFLVTFDSPNYVYVNDITVEVIENRHEATLDTLRQGQAPPRSHEGTRTRAAGFSPRGPATAMQVPQVIATRRRDNGNPQDVEIILDRPLPVGATTRFTLTDGVAVNVIEYTLTAALAGACCQADGTCETTTDPPCTLDGGTFLEGESCTAPQACCLPVTQGMEGRAGSARRAVGPTSAVQPAFQPVDHQTFPPAETSLSTGLCQMLDPVCCAAVGGALSAEPACEGDADFDGVDGACGDPCPLDFFDDADGDGVCWPEDQCPNDPLKTDPGVCGCHVSDTDDSDGDGVPDCIDVCPGVDDATYAPHCATAIPAAGTWGAAILALLLLTAAKLATRTNGDRAQPDSIE